MFHFQLLYGTFKDLNLLTPWFIFSPEVDRDVMDAENTCQVYPQEDTFSDIFRNGTLSSPDTQICLQSIYSVACLCEIFSKTREPLLLI